MILAITPKERLTMALDLKDLPRAIGPTTHTFKVDVVGDRTGQKFAGEFTTSIPNIKQKARISKLHAELNEYSDKVAPEVDAVHQMIAYLRVVLTDTPKWWQDAEYGYALYDTEVLVAVFREALGFETKWTEQIWGTQETKA